MKNPRFLKRLLLPLAIAVGVGAVAYAILNAFNDNLTFFYTPTQLLAGEVPQGKTYRLGGMVQKGSIQRKAGTLEIRFVVTDETNTVPVVYNGIVPDLFKEGKGVVAGGSYQNGIFVAEEVLAKHDENYMPPKLKK